MSRKGQKPEEQEAVSLMGARQEAKIRSFANPQTGGEAYADLPSMEHLANGYNVIQPDGKILTKEDILKGGTLLQKIRLYISSIDLSGYFEAKEKLTEEELNQIRASIRTKEDKELVSLCVKEYNTIFDFGTRLSFFFKRFQTSYAVLAVLLNKWDSYEYTAKQLTQLYNIMRDSYITIIEEDEDLKTKNLKDVELYTDGIIENFTNDLLRSNILEDAAMRFNKKTGEFYVDVEVKGGLYSKIIEEAKSATKDLSDFKAYTVVAEDYIKKSTLKYMPIPIQMSVENAEEERYTRYLVKNLRYFRSELNQRKERGETVTPGDEKRAVIPDFYEVKPSKNVLADCKVAISKK